MSVELCAMSYLSAFNKHFNCEWDFVFSSAGEAAYDQWVEDQGGLCEFSEKYKQLMIKFVKESDATMFVLKWESIEYHNS